jgi:hypothetical protein
MFGWDPRHAQEAEARLMASGRYCLVAAEEKPLPPAFSLAKHKIKSYDQGPNGTCWTFSPKQLGETMAKALGYAAFPISSRMLGWYAKKHYEGGGSQTEGGSPTDAIRAMTSQGCGICPEYLCPYSTESRVLDSQPADAAFAAAKKSSLLAPVVVKGLAQAKQLVISGRGVANGVPWPGNFEQPGPFHSKLGPRVGGHSVLLIGFAAPGVFDQHAWLNFDNWRRPQYKALPPDLAAKVPGYAPTTPTATTDLWIREDVYVELCRGQVTEHISATDLSGLTKGVVVKGPSFDEALI